MIAALLIAAGTSAQSAARTEGVSIVLVHGALLDGSSWRGVYDILTRDGYRVSIVQEPLSGFAEDVAATKRVLDQQDGPVVLVGHSYGGSIITVAGTDPKVKALVYVAALQPDVGETSAQVAAPMPPVSSHLKRTEDGFVFLDPAKFAADFGADLPRAEAEFLAHAQVPVSAAVFNTKLTAAAWHRKPSYAIITTEDRELNPKAARWMARRAGSKVTFLRAGHDVYIAHPRAVAKVIETAARAIGVSQARTGAPSRTARSGAPAPAHRQDACTSILLGRSSARFGMRTVSTPSLRFASIFPVSSSPLSKKLRR